PNAIDTVACAAADPAAAGLCRAALLQGAPGPLVLAVGNVRPAKGHAYLLEATACLRARFPGLRVVIVGRGGEHWAPLRARITALRLDDILTLAGERREVASLLQAADLFVQPSVIEGLPLALLEALAAGVPTVATAVGGVPRVVEDRITGRLVPPAAPLALAEAMGDLIDHPDRARRMAADAQERVQRLYGAQAWVDRLQRIYTAAAGAVSCMPASNG